jgi:hypothetical protein
MPDLPISALPSLSTPEPTDIFAIVNGGITKKTTVQDVGTSVFNQISSSVILPSQTGSFTNISTFNSYTSSINSFTSSVVTTASFNQYTGSTRSYYLSAFHTASMGVAVINTPYTMSFNSVDFGYGISISGSSRDKIKFEYPGIYDIQFSAQIDRADSANSTAYIWIRKNDLDVPTSNTGLAIAGGSNDANVASWNWFVSASAGDYYQLMYAATDTNTRILYNPSPTVGPAVPSVILTVDRVG